MNIQNLADRGLVTSWHGEPLEWGNLKDASIDQTAVFKGDLRLGRAVCIGGAAIVGSDCAIDDMVQLDAGVYLGSRVSIGRHARLERRTTVFIGSQIGESAALEAGVIVGPGVHVPAEAQVGANIVIPSTRTIMTLGRLGTSERMMIVHGSDNGPCYSAGCQYSDDYRTIATRIEENSGTTPESAMHYRRYLDAGVLEAIGDIVQAYYDEEVSKVAALREQAVALRQ